MPRASQVWRSRLPLFLKMGVAGAAEALANDDGTYSKPLTVQRLMEHEYYNGERLSERTIRYQLRACEALGILVVDDPTAQLSRGHPRRYRFVAAALAALDLDVPALRPPHRRKGATERGQQKGATELIFDAPEGGNKGGNKGGNSEIDPYRYVVLSTSAPPRGGGPVENADENRDGSDGESTTPNTDLCANRGADSDDAGGGADRRRSDQAAAPGARVPVRERSDSAGDRRGDRSGARVEPTQATLGPLDVSLEQRRENIRRVHELIRSGLERRTGT